MFLLVPAHPGSHRQRAVKRSLLLLLFCAVLCMTVVHSGAHCELLLKLSASLGLGFL